MGPGNLSPGLVFVCAAVVLLGIGKMCSVTGGSMNRSVRLGVVSLLVCVGTMDARNGRRVPKPVRSRAEKAETYQILKLIQRKEKKVTPSLQAHVRLIVDKLDAFEDQVNKKKFSHAGLDGLWNAFAAYYPAERLKKIGGNAAMRARNKIKIHALGLSTDFDEPFFDEPGTIRKGTPPGGHMEISRPLPPLE